MEDSNAQQQNPQNAPLAGANKEDVDKNKAFAIIGYIVPVLFFIPLVTDAKESPFAKFHANQQLNLLLFAIVGSVASSVLTFILIGFLIGPIVAIASLVFAVIGVINSINGEMKPLPLIGKFSLLK